MQHENTSRNWLLKYKLYHIPFWCLYHYLWWVVAMGNPLKAANSIFFTPQTVQFVFFVIFQAIAVYFNLYFLIPRYLEKSKFPAYLTYLFITILCATLLIVSGYYLSGFISGKSLEQIYGKGVDCFAYFFGNAFPSTMASMTFAMSIKLTKNWIQTKRKQHLLEKEKLETELKFLKNQFNPHFLFNTINSIFFLIHKNHYKASASLAKFSELLRYQLYECNDKQIPLSSEITYLENFIELEKLRQNDNIEVTVHMNQQYTKHLGIAPFILMTFVENAFKHVSKHTDKPNWIRIQLNLDQEQLNFSISNSTAAYKSNDVIHYGGIGLKNVQRRLELIYAGKYELDVENNKTSFEVRLRLNLSELVMPEALKKTA
jgi:two-component system LytT family sensor kinase